MTTRFAQFAAVAALFSVGLVAAPSRAATVTFDLRDLTATGAGSAISGSSSKTYTTTYPLGSITATFTALLDGVASSGTTLNRTSNSFGINASGSGDDTDEFDNDGGLGIESIRISFDQAVTLDGLTFSQFGGTDRARLTFPPSTSIEISTSTYLLTPGTNTLAANTPFNLAYEAGNGFAFDSFTVSTIGSPVVPLPAAAFGGMALLGTVGFLKRRRKLV